MSLSKAERILDEGSRAFATTFVVTFKSQIGKYEDKKRSQHGCHELNIPRTFPSYSEKNYTMPFVLVSRVSRLQIFSAM